MMSKATLLGQWHSLPGPALEVALRVRIDSVVSCGLGLAAEPRSADKEAAWLKKGKRSHYGYRRHVTAGGGDGHVRGIHTAPANEGEVGRFEGALKAAAPKAARVLAGKGYASAANRKPLKAPAQMRHHAQGGTQQTLDGKAKTGEPLDRQKALYRRAMFRDDEAAVRDGQGALFGRLQSQRPSVAQRPVHELAQGGQQGQAGKHTPDAALLRPVMGQWAKNWGLVRQNQLLAPIATQKYGFEQYKLAFSSNTTPDCR